MPNAALIINLIEYGIQQQYHAGDMLRKDPFAAPKGRYATSVKCGASLTFSFREMTLS
jgi:hypothetical protein